jgi:redox-sensitive bicupin YhaK (pirin superfamily)
MITPRRSDDRGKANHDWLQTKHTFSFATYRDPRFVGFQRLIVINEDHIAPSSGFGTHHHDNMEIITYVISGQLEHKDSMGTGSIIRAGDVQYMSAGTGVDHSEYNPSASQPVHLLQMWLLPNKHGHEPTYDQRHFRDDEKRNELRLIATDQAGVDAIVIRSDAQLYGCLLDAGQTVEHALKPHRSGWLQLVSGELDVNGVDLSAGDGIAVTNESALNIAAIHKSEFVLYDIAEA